MVLFDKGESGGRRRDYPLGRVRKFAESTPYLLKSSAVASARSSSTSPTVVQPASSPAACTQFMRQFVRQFIPQFYTGDGRGQHSCSVDGCEKDTRKLRTWCASVESCHLAAHVFSPVADAVRADLTGFRSPALNDGQTQELKTFGCCEEAASMFAYSDTPSQHT